MAKMGDFFINITTAGDDDEGEWMSIGKGELIGVDYGVANGNHKHAEPEPTADLSQITADLEKLPKAEPPTPQTFASSSLELSQLSYDNAKKWIGQMYGVPGKLIEEPSPEVRALRKIIEVLEAKLKEMKPGQSQTIVAPIYTPPTSVVYDPGIPPKLTIKTLTVTIRLEE